MRAAAVWLGSFIEDGQEAGQGFGQGEGEGQAGQEAFQEELREISGASFIGGLGEKLMWKTSKRLWKTSAW